MLSLQYTPHEDVNQILNLLLKEIQDILGGEFLGMYLFGSLANGDFDGHSDVDVLIVTHHPISEEVFASLRDMHIRISKTDSVWANQLEVSYIPQKALRRFDNLDKHHPHLDRGNGEVLHMMSHESDWVIQRHIMRDRGIIIAGPHLNSLIDSIVPGELQKAVADVLPFWVNPILEDPSQIKSRGYQSFFVLSLCRMLYTLKHGEVLSKPAAAAWALQNLDGKWKLLIEDALIGRQNAGMQAQPEKIEGTLQMMKYVCEQTKPTPYPEVNEVLNLLVRNAKEILDEQFLGMYLYGSLSSGDFNPETSDIDFLVVTREVLSRETIAQLEEMHNKTWATSLKRAGKLEGAYIHKELLRKHDPNGQPCPTINEGKFYLDRPGSDWIIQRHVVREYGVVLEGPDPKTLIDFVTAADIRNSIMGVLREWWYPMLENPDWLRENDDGYRSFAVITMCRVFHGLEHGTITSKPKAVQWARAKVEPRWHSLIDNAVAVSNHEERNVDLDETLGFIQYTKERIEENS